MNLKDLFTDERAVSPVVGVALLIAIAVILATVIGFVVIGISPSGAEAPSADMNANYNSTSNNLTVTHNGGDALNGNNVVLIDEQGNEVPLANYSSEFSAGTQFTINGTASNLDLKNSDVIRVVWQSPNSDKETVVSELDLG